MKQFLVSFNLSGADTDFYIVVADSKEEAAELVVQPIGERPENYKPDLMYCEFWEIPMEQHRKLRKGAHVLYRDLQHILKDFETGDYFAT